ncbi:hypothetical protein JM93_00971 [Roseibium hamelinense]|uniref:Uncharacterized protein n=1 Tax=Roseibium hamelinense TaxID=150831 RepID=A0A562TJ55_9HYPH|nr:hypothetical protein JM93_00971 [Roseibium hamelinense]
MFFIQERSLGNTVHFHVFRVRHENKFASVRKQILQTETANTPDPASKRSLSGLTKPYLRPKLSRQIFMDILSLRSSSAPWSLIRASIFYRANRAYDTTAQFHKNPRAAGSRLRLQSLAQAHNSNSADRPEIKTRQFLSARLKPRPHRITLPLRQQDK